MTVECETLQKKAALDCIEQNEVTNYEKEQLCMFVLRRLDHRLVTDW